MKRGIAPPEEPAEEGVKWLTTFNDLMTLLMVFFVLLFTMSSIDAKKMDNFRKSLQGGLGIMFEGKNLSIGVVNPVVRQRQEERFQEKRGEKRLEEGQRDAGAGPQTSAQGAGGGAEGRQSGGGSPLDMKTAAEKLGSVPGASVRTSEAGVTVALEDCLLFALGDAEINPEGFALLDRISAVLLETDGPVRIEGHTDNLPIRSDRYPSNWELSTARAVNVLKYMIECGGIAPQRLSAAGYGASKPLTANDSPEHRAKNRRVELVLLKAPSPAARTAGRSDDKP